MARHQLKLNWKANDKPAPKLTHEQFVHEVAKLGVSLLQDDADKASAQAMKLTYGVGSMRGARGVTYFNRWLNDKAEQAHFVEICAHGEENPVQLAGTTLHELGHVIAGATAGHKKEWHCACDKLGLRAINAGGTAYKLSMFDSRIRAQIADLCVRLNDGKPVSSLEINLGTLRPCSAGIGTRGGKSRGVGSGSRLRKWVCACEKPVILRVASDELDARCNVCMSNFVKG